MTGRCTSFASRNSKSFLKKGMFCIARHAKHFGSTLLITYGTNQRAIILLTGCWKRCTPKKASAVPHPKCKIGPFLRNFWVTLTFAGSFVSNTLGLKFWLSVSIQNRLNFSVKKHDTSESGNISINLSIINSL